MINKVPRNYEFHSGDLIYVEDNPALVLAAYPTWIEVLMLFDGKVKSKRIARKRIGAFWNNVQIDYHSTINLTPDMKTLIGFLTGVPSAYRGR